MLNINQRYLCYIVASLFSIPTPVLAIDLPWLSPYVGVYLGGGLGNNRISTDVGSVTNTSYFTTSDATYAVNSAGSWQNEPSAAIVGLQIGHDWVWNQLAYGVVLDYGSLSLTSSKRVTNTYSDSSGTYSLDTSMNTNWLFTLRGKLGYQKMQKYPSLLYLTGGMAMTKLKLSNSFTDTTSLGGTGGGATAQNQIGWTVGAGVEVAAFKHITVNFEYLYIDIPSLNTTNTIFNSQGGFGIPEQSLTSSVSTTENLYANLFKIELNYRFDE